MLMVRAWLSILAGASSSIRMLCVHLSLLAFRMPIMCLSRFVAVVSQGRPALFAME